MSETTGDIPLNIISTEEREDGVYVTAEVPDRNPHTAAFQSDDDLVEGPPVPPLTRAEMNDLLEKEGLSVRVRDEPETEEDIQAARQAAAYSANNRQLAQIFQSQSKQETVTNPNKDRSLSGKARRKARRGN